MALTQDIRTMNPRELVRGLMRGDPARFKQGYTAANAVLAASEAQGISDRTVSDSLMAYAEGYAAGLAEGREES